MIQLGWTQARFLTFSGVRMNSSLTAGPDGNSQFDKPLRSLVQTFRRADRSAEVLVVFPDFRITLHHFLQKFRQVLSHFSFPFSLEFSIRAAFRSVLKAARTRLTAKAGPVCPRANFSLKIIYPKIPCTRFPAYSPSFLLAHSVPCRKKVVPAQMARLLLD